MRRDKLRVCLLYYITDSKLLMIQKIDIDDVRNPTEFLGIINERRYTKTDMLEKITDLRGFVNDAYD